MSWRDACELFDEQAAVPPKRRRPNAGALIERGHPLAGDWRALYNRRSVQLDRESRRLIVAGHHHPGGTSKQRVGSDVSVNPKLLRSIVSEGGLRGAPHPL